MASMDAKTEGRVFGLSATALAIFGFVAPYRWHELPPLVSNFALIAGAVFAVAAVWHLIPARWRQRQKAISGDAIGAVALSAAVQEAADATDTVGKQRREDRSSLEMQFLRRRWWYALFANVNYRAKRRIEFIEAWDNYFTERRTADLSTKNKAQLAKENAIDRLALEARNAVYHLAVMPDQLEKELLAHVQAKLTDAKQN